MAVGRTLWCIQLCLLCICVCYLTLEVFHSSEFVNSAIYS